MASPSTFRMHKNGATSPQDYIGKQLLVAYSVLLNAHVVAEGLSSDGAIKETGADQIGGVLAHLRKVRKSLGEDL